ncbi:MAG TPA: MXAN_6640 family putative metalloprotease [Gaiellaceae bacterium]
MASACDSTLPLCFHWDENPADADAPPGADGVAATIPADVQATMDTFADVWGLEIDTYGFLPPLPDATSTNDEGTDDTDIYLADLGGDTFKLFGYYTTDDPNAYDPDYPFYDVSAYCVVDEDFAAAQFGNSQTPEEFRDVTVAHEFFHAVQFHYDWFEDLWLMEGTAMVMEGQFRPDVKDRIRYLDDSTFTSPPTPVDRSAGGFEYGAWIFWRFLIEDRGELANPLIIRQIWERVAAASTDTDGPGPDTVASDQYSLQGTRNVLASRGLVFKDVFKHFAWVNRIPASFYQEGADYPIAVAPASYTLGPSRLTTDWHSYKLRHLASRYVVFKPSAGGSPTMHIRVRVNLPNIGYAPAATLLVRNVGGTFNVRPIKLDSAGNGSLVVSLGRGSIKEVDLVLTNASTRMSCWRDTFYSCAGVGLDDLRTYKFRATVS